MKEAYGSATSIWLFMVFFVVYVCFIAVALQFAKTYRVKNYVINVLEQYRYAGTVNDSALDHLDSYLSNVPYTTSDETAQANCNSGVVYHGVCIIPEGTTDAPYYKVVVYFEAEFPFLQMTPFTIPVSGETTVIDIR